MTAKHLHYAVVGINVFARQELMLKRHDIKMPSIKSLIWKLSDEFVHSSLFGEHIDESAVIAIRGLEARQEPFEQRETTIGKSDGIKLRLINNGFLHRLLHNGWELLVVAYQDKSVNSLFLFVVGG